MLIKRDTACHVAPRNRKVRIRTDFYSRVNERVFCDGIRKRGVVVLVAQMTENDFLRSAADKPYRKARGVLIAKVTARAAYSAFQLIRVSSILLS